MDQRASCNTGNFKTTTRPCVVAHTYNPCYSEGGNMEEQGSRPGEAKKDSKTPFQPSSKHGGCVYNSSYSGYTGRRIMVGD
jgi:hypothetical protein